MTGPGEVTPIGPTPTAAPSPDRSVYGSGTPDPTVEKPSGVVVFGWSRKDAVAAVDGVTVRIRRRADGEVRWICVQHGEGTNPGLCGHTEALAATPAPLDKLNGPLPAEGWWEQ